MDQALSTRVARWLDADAHERRAIADDIAGASNGALAVARAGVFLHRPSSILFNLVPGGTFEMGFASSELDRLRARYQYWDECDEAELVFSRVEVGCVRDIRIAPFLLAARPLSASQLEALTVGETPSLVTPRSHRSLASTDDEGRALPSLEAIAKLPAKKYLAYLESFSSGTFDTTKVAEIERFLDRVGLRLPSDAEREHAARAGTQNLFPHGDDIPRSPNIGENPFGFIDLGADAEVCADGWVATLDGIPDDGRPRPPADDRAARGGAASCYPWQGCAEWTLLLCAYRAPATSHSGFLVARPALSL